jgi:TolB-like protein
MVLITFISTNVAAQDREADPKRPTLKRRTEGDAQQSNLDQRVADLSEQISKEMSENQKKTIAVIEFVDLKGNVTDFGRYLAEKLITKLVQTKKFKVIERQLLNRVIAEQKLSLTGTIDPSSAKQLGKLLGVDAICSGTISDLAQTLDVNGRLISTETGEIFAVASTIIPKDDSVTNLMSGGTSSVIPSKPGDSSGAGNRSAPQKTQAQFFTFELKQCRMSGNSVVCDLLITNNDRDRELQLKRGTLFDEVGNSHNSNSIQLANELYSGQQLLISGVPTSARVKFDGVSPQASRITLLRISLWVQSGTFFEVEFRNVSLVR